MNYYSVRVEVDDIGRWQVGSCIVCVHFNNIILLSNITTTVD